MKHLEAIELQKKLVAVKGLKSVDVNYAIEENLVRLGGAIKPLNEQEKKIEEKIKEFADERQKIGEKLSMVDGETKTKQIGDLMVFDIPADKMVDYNKQVDALRKKHAAVIKTYEEERSKFNKMLETGENPVKLYMIKLQHVPADISTEAMKAIFPLIKRKTTEE